jgi:hypothetical protein
MEALPALYQPQKQQTRKRQGSREREVRPGEVSSRNQGTSSLEPRSGLKVESIWGEPVKALPESILLSQLVG